MAEQVATLAARFEVLDSTVTSDRTRLESLELHTRRTDAKLTQLVDEKLSELQLDRVAEIEQVRADLANALVGRLGDVRVEIAAVAEKGGQALAAAVEEGDVLRRDLTASFATQLEQVRAELQNSLRDESEDVRDRLATAADAARAELSGALHTVLTATESTGARVQALEKRLQREQERGREVEARIDGLAEARKADVQALTTQLAELREKVASAVSGINTRSSRAREQVGNRFDELTGRVEEVTTALARAASAESGALAPLRSDMRLLQRQVAELAEALEARTTRRTPANKPLPATKAVPTTKAVTAPKARRPAPARPAPVKAPSAKKAATATRALATRKAPAAKATPPAASAPRTVRTAGKRARPGGQ